MRCVFADTDNHFLTGLRRCFKYTPVEQEDYPVVVHGQPVAAWNAVPPRSTAWLVVPGEDENRLRLEQQGAGSSVRFKLFCPAAVGCNTRQLVRAVLKYVATHGTNVDFIVIPRLGEASAVVARNMHAGYVDGVAKKSGGRK